MYWDVKDNSACNSVKSLEFKGCVATTDESESDYSLDKGCGGSLYIEASEYTFTGLYTGITFMIVGSDIGGTERASAGQRGKYECIHTNSKSYLYY